MIAVPDSPAKSVGANKAWRMPRPAELKRVDQSATVGVWVVEVPGAHAFWRHWLMTAIHLRDIAGAPAAHLQHPAATHEFIWCAVDPDDPTASSGAPIAAWASTGVRFLQPIDFVGQVCGLTDAQAERMLEQAVDLVMVGKMSPDQDFRRWWSGWLADAARELGGKAA